MFEITSSKKYPDFRIIYWLDAFVCEVCVVRVERR